MVVMLPVVCAPLPFPLHPPLSDNSARLSAHCQWVIFVNGPIYSVAFPKSLFGRQATPEPERHLAEAYRSVLETAKHNHVRDFVRSIVSVNAPSPVTSSLSPAVPPMPLHRCHRNQKNHHLSTHPPLLIHLYRLCLSQTPCVELCWLPFVAGARPLPPFHCHPGAAVVKR